MLRHARCFLFLNDASDYWISIDASYQDEPDRRPAESSKSSKALDQITSILQNRLPVLWRGGSRGRGPRPHRGQDVDIVTSILVRIMVLEVVFIQLHSARSITPMVIRLVHLAVHTQTSVI